MIPNGRVSEINYKKINEKKGNMIQEGREIQNYCIINHGVQLVTSIRLSCRGMLNTNCAGNS